MAQLPDVPALDNRALYTFLSAVRKNLTDQIAAAVATSTGSGAREPRSFALDFGGNGDGVTLNDAMFLATETATDTSVWIGDGIFATSLAKSALTKRYDGTGLILLPAAALPANFAYIATKPTTWPVQGEPGWFRGDQRGTNGGQWHIIGTGVRSYDITARYFESNVIPEHAWLDVESGSSGAQAYLTAGGTAGTNTITLPAAGSAEWIGKQVNITWSFGGVVAEVLTVQNVVGAVVTFTTNLVNSYVWNPAAVYATGPVGVIGLPKVPCLQFAPRTWGGQNYTRVRHRAPGDGYGYAWRMNVEYNPKANELLHPFLAGTAGQCGGSVDFQAGSTGMYATGWESMYYDHAEDVTVIARVDTIVRDNDRADASGRAHLGARIVSSGRRPADAADVFAGHWRVGVDTSLATLKDSSYLSAGAAIGAATISVHSTNGARLLDTITVTRASDGAVYAGTISSVAAGVIGITPNMTLTMVANDYVEYPKGGSIVNAALGQRISWNGSGSSSGRGGDSLGVWGPLYGNVVGDLETGSDNDASGDHWFTRFNGLGHAGATARIRLYTTDFRCSVKILGGNTIEATKELVTNGYTGTTAPAGGTVAGAVIFGAGSGNQLFFNTTTNNFEYYKAGTLVASV